MYSYSVQSLTLLLKTVPFLPGQDDGVLELVVEVVVVIEVPDGVSLVELESVTPEVDEEKLFVEDSSSDEVVEVVSSADEETLLRVVVALPDLVDVKVGSTGWLVEDTSAVVVEPAPEVVEEAPTPLDVLVALMVQSPQLLCVAFTDAVLSFVVTSRVSVTVVVPDVMVM